MNIIEKLERTRINTAGRYSTAYVGTIPATDKPEGLERELRDYVKANMPGMRVSAKGRGANRCERWAKYDKMNGVNRNADSGRMPRCFGREASWLPRTVADTLDLYIHAS